jgi:DNA-binding NarL/FixJ family response regulator
MGGILLNSSCRILIADEYEAIRTGVRSFLEVEDGWQVIAEACRGHDALRLARETGPDIAILDTALPQMNGLEVTRNIKRLVPGTEVLVYSMHDKDSIVAEVLRAGARGYVLKSDPASRLVAAVRALATGKPYISPAISEAILENVLAPADGRSANKLTPRECEIVQLVAEGRINKQIAHELDISTKTVETHRSAVMHKLKLRTTAQLVLYAVRNDIVQP